MGLLRSTPLYGRRINTPLALLTGLYWRRHAGRLGSDHSLASAGAMAQMAVRRERIGAAYRRHHLA
jgi:hypothetical protein